MSSSNKKRRITTNECKEVSLNHKMDTINAALLLVALKHLPEKRKKRESIAIQYDNELSDYIYRQGYGENEIHGRYVYAIKAKKRDKLKKYLESHHIETKIFNHPLACDAPVYKKYNKHDVPIARKMLEMNLIIPSHENLNDNQIKYLIANLNNFYLNQ